MGRSNTAADESEIEAGNQITLLDSENSGKITFRRRKYCTTLKSTKAQQPVCQQLIESYSGLAKVSSTIEDVILKISSSLKVLELKDSESEIVPTQSDQKKCVNIKRRFNVTTPLLYENRNESEADFTVNEHFGNDHNNSLSWEHSTTTGHRHIITLSPRSPDQDCESIEDKEVCNVSETDEFFSCNSFTSATSNTSLPTWYTHGLFPDVSEMEFGKIGKDKSSADSVAGNNNANNHICDASSISSEDDIIFLNQSFGISEFDGERNPLVLPDDSIFGEISQIVIDKTVGVYILPSAVTIKMLKDAKKDEQVVVKKEYKAQKKCFDFEALAQKEMEDEIRKELEESEESSED